MAYLNFLTIILITAFLFLSLLLFLCSCSISLSRFTYHLINQPIFLFQNTFLSSFFFFRSENNDVVLIEKRHKKSHGKQYRNTHENRNRAGQKWYVAVTIHTPTKNTIAVLSTSV